MCVCSRTCHIVSNIKTISWLIWSHFDQERGLSLSNLPVFFLFNHHSPLSPSFSIFKFSCSLTLALMRSMNKAKKQNRSRFMDMNIYENLCTCCDALKQQQQQPGWFCLRSQRAAVCVCVAAGVNYRKWFLLGVWRPLALVISIHANTFPSLCASHAACFCGACVDTHNQALHVLRAHTHTNTWFLHSLFLIFFFSVTQPGSIPLCLICMCVGVSGSSDDVRNWCWQLWRPSVTWSWHIFVCLE